MYILNTIHVFLQPASSSNKTVEYVKTTKYLLVWGAVSLIFLVPMRLYARFEKNNPLKRPISMSLSVTSIADASSRRMRSHYLCVNTNWDLSAYAEKYSANKNI